MLPKPGFCSEFPWGGGLFHLAPGVGGLATCLSLSHTDTRMHAHTHSLAGLSGSPAPSPGPAVCLAFPGPPLPKRGMLATRWPLARSDSPRHLPVAATRLNIT